MLNKILNRFSFAPPALNFFLLSLLEAWPSKLTKVSLAWLFLDRGGHPKNWSGCLLIKSSGQEPLHGLADPNSDSIPGKPCFHPTFITAQPRSQHGQQAPCPRLLRRAGTWNLFRTGLGICCGMGGVFRRYAPGSTPPSLFSPQHVFPRLKFTHITRHPGLCGSGLGLLHPFPAYSIPGLPLPPPKPGMLGIRFSCLVEFHHYFQISLPTCRFFIKQAGTVSTNFSFKVAAPMACLLLCSES